MNEGRIADSGCIMEFSIKRFILVSLQSDYRTIEVSTIVYASADLIYKVVESVLFKAHVPLSNP